VSHGITGGTFSLGSLQNHSATDVESGDACIISSNSPNYSPGTGCANGLTGVGSSGVGSVTLSWGSSDFVEFITNPNQTDPSGNFLVDTLTVDTTPEPPTLILFGTMLLGLALVGRRRWATLLG
ncbi:MAG: PEP-CTERM sorting domain-containing protein, partial [Terriglobales bacterium]